MAVTTVLEFMERYPFDAHWSHFWQVKNCPVMFSALDELTVPYCYTLQINTLSTSFQSIWYQITF